MICDAADMFLIQTHIHPDQRGQSTRAPEIAHTIADLKTIMRHFHAGILTRLKNTLMMPASDVNKDGSKTLFLVNR